VRPRGMADLRHAGAIRPGCAIRTAGAICATQAPCPAAVRR
jgi:hypothetical protein